MKKKDYNKDGCSEGSRNRTRKTAASSRSAINKTRSERNLNEMLKMCLLKVCELEMDLERFKPAILSEEDAESAGYAACLDETMRFLRAQGLDQNHPVVRGLSDHLLRQDE